MKKLPLQTSCAAYKEETADRNFQYLKKKLSERANAVTYRGAFTGVLVRRPSQREEPGDIYH